MISVLKLRSDKVALITQTFRFRHTQTRIPTHKTKNRDHKEVRKKGRWITVSRSMLMCNIPYC